MEHPALQAGLYLVATPIGTAGDITLRALDILAKADAIAAEDTRQARKLMDIHGIALNKRPLIPYHDHNGATQRPRLLELVRGDKSLAYVSDAGTPLIADPGYKLAQTMIAEGLPVTSAPGASALLAALSVSGLPTDRFLFAGFLPPKSAARRSALRELSSVPATLVFFESPNRLPASLADMFAELGNRPAAICRELTKKFEEIRRGSLQELCDSAAQMTLKGEFVVVLGPPEQRVASQDEIDSLLREALKTQSVNDAATHLSTLFHQPRKLLYARALKLKESPE